MTHLSIIIVSYNVEKLLKNCLKSVFSSQTKYNFEVFVHDNGSKDQTTQMVQTEFPEVKLIAGENIGFSAGNNVAIKQSTGKYVLLLNPDTEVAPDTFEKMLDLMEQRPEIGMATGKVILPDGSLDKACRRSFPTPAVSFARLSGLGLFFPKSRTFNKYNLGYLSEDEEYEIDSCVGAFQMVRRKTIDEIGLLDETFFLYGEDLDWCYRAKAAGWKVYYYPQTTIVHHKRQSSGLGSYHFSKKALWEFYRAMIIFHRKHFAPQYLWFVNQFIYLSIYSLYALKLTIAYIKLFLGKIIRLISK